MVVRFVVFFPSNSNMEFLSTWKNLNLYVFIRWARVDPDSYLKERKKRIETKKKGSKLIIKIHSSGKPQ